MGDAETALPPSKKRAAGREISRDNPGLDDEEDTSEQEPGTFKRASDEVLATRRIVKVRRKETASTPSSNPFAGIRLVPPSAPTPVTTAEVASSEKVSEEGKPNSSEDAEKGKDDNHKQPEVETHEPPSETAIKTLESGETTEDQKGGAEPAESKETPVDGENANEKEKAESKVDEKTPADGENAKEKEKAVSKVDDRIPEDGETQNKEAAGNNEVGSEEKKGNCGENADQTGKAFNSFQQLSSSRNAFTGLAGTGFSASTFSFGSVSKDGSSLGTSPTFGFGLANGSSLFNATGSSIASKSEGSSFPSKQEVTVETGEENEKVVFTADSVLFEFLDGSWKERGKGELKLNVSTTETDRARLLMRARGNYRLILNARLYPDIKLTNMDKKGITFACMNSTTDAKDGLSTFALKFKDASIVEEFRAAVTAHKGKTTAALKTPENSPKASEE